MGSSITIEVEFLKEWTERPEYWGRNKGRLGRRTNPKDFLTNLIHRENEFRENT